MPELQDIETAMITALEASSAFPGNNVGRWSGEVEELLTNPRRIPSAWVIYQGATFKPRKLLGVNLATGDQSWSVLLFLSMLRGLQTSAEESVFAKLNTVRSALTGLTVDGAEMWPAGEQLVESVAGVVVYESRFTISIN